MSERKRILFLITIMVTVSLVVAGISIYTLYNVAIEEERDRLVETAQSQARLIEAVARFDAIYSKEDHPEGPAAATLSQIIDAHEKYKGFGKTGEFTLARHEGDYIVFLLSHRHYDLQEPKPVPFDSDPAEPMRRALSGLSGTVIGLDYRHEVVVAAYEPVAELNLGIVAKIDLAEIREPFLRAGMVAMGSTLLIVLVAVVLFLKISNPIINKLRESEKRYRLLFNSGNDAVFVSDMKKQKFIEVNDTACMRLGYDTEELLELSPIDIIIREESRGAPFFDPQIMEKFLADKHIIFEAMHVTKDGRRIPVEVNSHLFDLNDQTSVLSIARDITKRKRAEEELRKHQEHVEELVEERTTELKSANLKLQQEITERKRLEEILRNIAEGISAEVGESFFTSLVSHLSNALHVDYAFVGSLNEDIQTVTTIALFERGEIKPNITYNLHGSPCKNVIGKEPCTYSKNVTKLFPKDKLLQEMGVECYMGYPLFGAKDQPLGILVIMDSKPLEELELMESLLRVFAVRAASELERKRAEEQIRRMSRGIESAGESVVMTDLEGTIQYINPAFTQLTGYTMEEAVGQNTRILKSGRQSWQFYKEMWDTILRGEVWSREVINRGKDKTLYNAILTIAPFFNERKKLEGFVAIQNDITERKRAEKDLEASRDQLRRLSAHIQTIREEERITIAREVHDELGQTLTALEIDIDWLKKKLPEDQKQLIEKTRSMLRLTDTTIKSVQKISAELRPIILDDLGLTAAIKWQASEFENRTGIMCEIAIKPEDIDLGKDCSTTIFRIFQETLTNVARHSEATKVKVSINIENDLLDLNVMDNGRGITEEEISNTHSLGLLGMRERLYPWNGEFEIKGQKGKGTTVRVRIPLS